MENKEKRYIKLDNQDISLRAKSTEEGKKILVGYGAVFNVRSKIITEWISTEHEYRTFHEVINTGAFDKALKVGNDIVLSFNHDFEQILARTHSKTLTLTVDDKGLRFECELPNTSLGNDIFEMVARGDYYECSFIFTVDKNGEEWIIDDSTGIWERHINSFSQIYDVTVCSYQGAYSQTDLEVAARNLKQKIESDILDDNTNDINNSNEKYLNELDIFCLEMKI